MPYELRAFRGETVNYTIRVVNDDGTPSENRFNGTETLDCVAWPGGQAPAVFTPLPRWTPPDGGPRGLIDLPLTYDVTGPVPPGKYMSVVRMADHSGVLAEGTIEILGMPSTALSPSGTYTRAMVDAVLLGRLGTLMLRSGLPLDGVSPVSQFADPITAALFFLKKPPLNPLAPGDDDIGRVSPGDWMALVDVAEFAAVSAAVSTMSVSTAGMVEEEWPDYRYRRDPQAMQSLIGLAGDKASRVRNLYGYGLGRLSLGSVTPVRDFSRCKPRRPPC